MIHSPNTPPAPLHKVGMRFFKNGCNGGAGVGVGVGGGGGGAWGVFARNGENGEMGMRFWFCNGGMGKFKVSLAFPS